MFRHAGILLILCTLSTSCKLLNVKALPFLSHSSISGPAPSSTPQFRAPLNATNLSVSQAGGFSRQTDFSTRILSYNFTPDCMTEMQDGKVLLTGGFDPVNLTSTAVQIYDPNVSLATTAAPMGTGRTLHGNILLPDGTVLVTGGRDDSNTSLASSEVYDPISDSWSSVAHMNTSRAIFPTITLPDGRILVVGGQTKVSGSWTETDSAEVYDPTLNTWTEVGPINQPSVTRAVLLNDGTVLVVSSIAPLTLDVPASFAQIFDPSNNSWTSVTEPALGRGSPTLTLMGNGKVLLHGGFDGLSAPVTATEAYDPVAQGWSTTTSPPSDIGITGVSAVTLRDGKVLVTGGVAGSGDPTGSSYIYDGVANSWLGPAVMPYLAPTSQTISWDAGFFGLTLGGDSHTLQLYFESNPGWSVPNPPIPDHYFASVVNLPDGRIMLLGGTANSLPATDVRLYDPVAGSWSTIASMNTPRANFASVLLNDGTVLVEGGIDSSGTTLDTAEIYDSENDIWTTLSDHLNTARAYHTAVTLRNGKVLITGGDDSGGNEINSTEIYDPTGETFLAGSPMTNARMGAETTLLSDGRVMVVGGEAMVSTTLTVLNSVEIYDPALDSWSSHDTLNGHYHHQMVTLHDGRVLVAGGDQDTSGTPAGADLFDGTSWSSVATPTAYRTNTAMVLLPDGRPLIIGGEDGGSNPLSVTEVYDPNTDHWSYFNSLSIAVMSHVATTLKDGRVLVLGGGTTGGANNDYELFTKWAPQTPVVSGCNGTYTWSLVHGTGTLYPNGLYVPNQSQAEVATVEVQSSDHCGADFTITSN